MKYRLLEDIYSNGKGRQPYGQAGDLVELLADHGEVFIVENKKGVRFPVSKSKCVIIQ